MRTPSTCTHTHTHTRTYTRTRTHTRTRTPGEQGRREWVEKPDGTLITLEAARASTKSMFKPGATRGVNYYEVLQVGAGAGLG